MATYTYQIQNSPDGITWSNVAGAAGSFDAVTPFSHDIQYTLQSTDVNNYIRCLVTDPTTGTQYSSGKVGPVTATAPPPPPPPPPPSGSGTPAAYPSILQAVGTSLVDENNYVMPLMKGFDIQVVPWAQADFDAIHAEGARLLRTVIFWNYLEPTQGNIDMTYVNKIDTHMQRLVAAGLYTTIAFYYGPNGVHCPTWVGGSQLGNYSGTNGKGQHATQFLANRYGNPSSPYYTKAVIGFGINEPTPDSTGNTYLATHFAEQWKMIDWFRAEASHWIGVLSCGWGSGAPWPDAPGSGQTTQTFAGAPTDASGGRGNVMMDLHGYKCSTTTPSRAWDGRNQYGLPNSSDMIDVGNTGYPPSGSTRTQCQAFLTAFVASHKYYCQSVAHIPFVMLEWGFKSYIYSGGDLFATDLKAALIAAGAAGICQWDFALQDDWAAYRNNVWNSATQAMMSGTTTDPTPPSPPPSGGGASSTFGGLHVSGNKLVNDNGDQLRLRGVHVVGFGYNAMTNGGIGGTFNQTYIDVLKSWRINVVRIGLAADAWLGINGFPKGITASAFKQAVIDFVNLCHSNQIYTELSLMFASTAAIQYALPGGDAIPFWTSCATAFKDIPNLFFGTYGEPHPGNTATGWTAWRDGGTMTDNGTYTGHGMQELVDTIRNTGATQPISVSGISYASNLCEWLTHRPSDSLNSIIAEHHHYGDEPTYIGSNQAVTNDSTNWDTVFGPITASVPLHNGEAGEYAHSDTCGFSSTQAWLTWMEAHGGSYCLWKWGVAPSSNPCQNMALLANSSGTPSPTYGAGYKSWLASHA